MSKTLLDVLKQRNLLDQVTSDEMATLLREPQAVYLGIDPTAPSIHLGNLVGIIVMKHFAQFGHKPVFIMGGATGAIGDPSGKSKERTLLTYEEVQNNAQAIEKDIVQFFGDSKEKPLFLNNYDWYANMNVLTYLRDIGKHFRLGPMLGKESVRTRMESDEGMSYTEFSYQLLQGYDFYHLLKEHKVTVQIGGSDQYGNITAGVDYVRRLSQDAVYGLTFPLLLRSDGKKLGKTEEGTIWLNADKCSPFMFYQYFFSLPDADVPKLMRMLTFMDIEEIDRYIEGIREQTLAPNAAQERLAEEMTRFVHGDEGLKVAQKATEALVPGRTDFDIKDLIQVSDTIPNVSLSAEEVVGSNFLNLSVRTGLLRSKTEGRNLIKNRGAYLNGNIVEDGLELITQEDLYQGEFLVVASGKKKQILVKVSEKTKKN